MDFGNFSALLGTFGHFWTLFSNLGEHEGVDFWGVFPDPTPGVGGGGGGGVAKNKDRQTRFAEKKRRS